MKVAALGAAAALVLLAPSPGTAQPATPQRIELRWEAPGSCPTEREVLDRVHARLGGAPPPGTGRRLVATGRVEQSDGRFQVFLQTELDGARGDRRLEGASCADVSEAAALVLALTYDPDLVAAASPPPKPAGPPPGPRAAPRPRPSPSAPSLGGPPWRFAVRAQAFALFGPLPNAAWGIGGGIALARERWSAELGAAYFPPQATTDDPAVLGGDFRLVTGSGAGCFAVLREPFELSPCVGIDVGSISGEGLHAPRVERGSGVWLAPFAQVLARVPLTARVGLRLEGAIGSPIYRPEFVMETLGVHRASAVAARLGGGVEIWF